MNKLKLIFSLIIFVGISGNVFSQTPSTTTVDPVVAELNLPDLSGKQRTLKEWQGKVLVVNFWATWCPPCRKEIPEFISLQKTFGEKGLQFIGIAIEAQAPVQEFAQSFGVNYPILIAGDDGIVQSLVFGNWAGGLPFTVIIDRQGQIRHRQAGEMSREQILEQIKPLL